MKKMIIFTELVHSLELIFSKKKSTEKVALVCIAGVIRQWYYCWRILANWRASSLQTI